MSIPSSTNDRDLSPFVQVFQLHVVQQLLNVMTSPNIFRFTFVRNPFTRALSCYLSKASPSSITTNKDIHLPKLEFPKSPEGITFREFLLAISKQKLLEMDIHWRPQFSQVFYDTIKYSFIGRYEKFGEDFKKALKHIFPKVSDDGSFLEDNPDTRNITRKKRPSNYTLIHQMFLNNIGVLLSESGGRTQHKPLSRNYQPEVLKLYLNVFTY